MMPDITFKVDIFRSQVDRKRSTKSLLWLLESLVQIDLLWLMAFPGTPSLYKADVKYLAEDGEELWQDISNILKNGYGDCEDLACWRCAELRFGGINAHPLIRWRDINGSKTMHALVRWPDGKVEDAALAMGMHGTMYRKPIFISEGIEK